MQAGNNEERFVLYKLGGSFQLVYEDGRAKLAMELHLEKAHIVI
jgi:hypothetical protein